MIDTPRILVRTCLLAAACIVPIAAAEVVAVDPLTTVVAYDLEHQPTKEDPGPRWLDLAAAVPDDQRREQIRLVGPRGGLASGQAVASQAVPARVGTLSGPDGASIPAGAISIRYGEEPGIDQPKAWRKSRHQMFHAKRDNGGELPADYRHWDAYAATDLRSKPPQSPGVVPIWITVAIPADAAPGTYGGTLHLGDHDLPLRLEVAGYRLPAPQTHIAYSGFDWSYDGLARLFEVEPGSDGHRAAITEAHAHLAPFGPQNLVVSLLAENYLGDEHGMLRFRRTGDGLVPDWTMVDWILDAYAADLGEPKSVVLHAWNVRHAGIKTKEVRGSKLPAPDEVRYPVSVIQADGSLQVEHIRPPNFPDHRALWQQVIVGMQERVAARGWEAERLILGSVPDGQPRKQTVNAFAELGLNRWLMTAHGRGIVLPEDPDEDLVLANGMVVTHYEHPWPSQASPREDGILGGWNLPFAVSTTGRNVLGIKDPLAQYRGFVDVSVAEKSGGGQDGWLTPFSACGVARLPLLRAQQLGEIDKRGLMSFATNEGGHSHAFPGILRINPEHLVTRDGDRLLPTSRMLMLLEGRQETTARIAIEKALVAGSLPEALAGRARSFLAERSRALTRDGKYPGDIAYGSRSKVSWEDTAIGVAEDWQDASRRLFDLAGEVQALRQD